MYCTRKTFFFIEILIFRGSPTVEIVQLICGYTQEKNRIAVINVKRFDSLSFVLYRLLPLYCAKYFNTLQILFKDVQQEALLNRPRANTQGGE